MLCWNVHGGDYQRRNGNDEQRERTERTLAEIARGASGRPVDIRAAKRVVGTAREIGCAAERIRRVDFDGRISGARVLIVTGRRSIADRRQNTLQTPGRFLLRLRYS